ncbi:SPFH domain-containing protein [Streptomyces sp. IBSNAI002]|uniref:SPFH domain-containing protein n=1 Tax=Streptomyces sp. IBSNAI002 TaxID=3457500 RepID=UPI003FD19F81
MRNEQSKERWPQISPAQALNTHVHTGAIGGLPMDDLFRTSRPGGRRSPAEAPDGAETARELPSVEQVAVPAAHEVSGQVAAVPENPPATAARTRNPRVDHTLQERTVSGVPGWCAMVTATVALAAAVWLLWLTGRLPGPLTAPVTDLLGEAPAKPVLSWGGPAIGLLVLCGAAALFGLAGLTRVRSGSAVVLHARGRYRATLRRTGLVWRSPLRPRRVVDVRLRHWRTGIDGVTDRDGTPVDAVLLVVWQVRNTARALYAVDDHESYLKEQIEAAAGEVFSTLPCDSFREREASLRDSRHLAGELTQALSADMRAIGLDVFSVQVVRLEYTAHVAEAMRQRRLSALEAKHREGTLEEVALAVEATTRTVTAQGGVEWDDYERKAFARELTVAFYAARTSAVVPAGPSSPDRP